MQQMQHIPTAGASCMSGCDYCDTPPLKYPGAFPLLLLWGGVLRRSLFATVLGKLPSSFGDGPVRISLVFELPDCHSFYHMDTITMDFSTV